MENREDSVIGVFFSCFAYAMLGRSRASVGSYKSGQTGTKTTYNDAATSSPVKIALKANRGEFKSEGLRARRKRSRQRDEETIGRM